MKKRVNEKNRFIKLAWGMSVVVLITVIIFGNSIAKYITTSSTSEEARVAKWGLNATTTLDLFETSYGDFVDGDEDKVIAPGTSGSFNFIIDSGENAPEVAYTLAANVSATYEGAWGNWISEPNTGPLRFSFGEKSNLSLSELVTELETTYTGNFDPRTLATFDETTIAWEWKFSDEKDALDTSVGNSAANAETKPTVKITVELIAQQISE